MTPREFRKLWIEALRSGEYTQGRLFLTDADGKYCCLGVACKLYDERIEKLPQHDLGRCIQYVSQSAYLPECVRKALALRTVKGSFSGELRGQPFLYSLAQLNDNGASFSLIAMEIEREPPGLIDKELDK